MRTRAGALFMGDVMTSFSKLALSIPDQVVKLEGRGLSISDRATAEHYLKHIGYYRLSAYALPFQNRSQLGKPFLSGTRFDQILDLYRFDRELRLLVLDGIERVEVALRSILNDVMSVRHGPHWFMEPRHFAPRFQHHRFIADIEDTLDITTPGGQPQRLHQEVFINHYYAKYGDPHLPPSWMVVEIFPLGSLSRLYANLRDGQERTAVATPFGMDEAVLRNWFHVLSHVRNLCAHHARLWNRQLVIKFRQVARRHQTFLRTTDRFYAVAVALYELLQRIAPGTHWNRHLCDLIDRYPVASLHPMGFPPNWSTEPFWNLGPKGNT